MTGGERAQGMCVFCATRIGLRQPVRLVAEPNGLVSGNPSSWFGLVWAFEPLVLLQGKWETTPQPPNHELQ